MEDDSSSNKVERKRQREKQRRSDLATAFDELGSLLRMVNPNEQEPPLRRRRSGSDSSDRLDIDPSGMTRLDLIQRSIETIRKLHEENKELKKAADDRQHHGDVESANQKKDDAYVMVPTYRPIDDNRPGGDAAVAAPHQYPSHAVQGQPLYGLYPPVPGQRYHQGYPTSHPPYHIPNPIYSTWGLQSQHDFSYGGATQQPYSAPHHVSSPQNFPPPGHNGGNYDPIQLQGAGDPPNPDSKHGI